MSRPAPDTQHQTGTFDFAGWGAARKLAIDPAELGPVSPPHRTKLGQWSATAICGNDITSSCLYVSALCAAQAGVLAPLVLLIVAGVLYLFRQVYAEVGSALPLNGGCYTVLLNTTTKKTAAAAACLTVLSYVATAVISAGEAMHYAHNLWQALDIFWATIALLALFTLLTVVGIAESAVVAMGIFIAHMLTLSALSIAAITRIVGAPELLLANWALPSAHSFGHALLFGFAAAMLGISGFESSANFIEEQGPGVFPKTLRNMWVAVAVFNPLISFVSMGLLPLAEIEQVPPDLLAQMAERTGGALFRSAVSIDAVLVLSGAVLTSFVGVNGLVRRMALDRCLPQFLLRANRSRGTNHWILIGFFLVCLTIMLITQGNIETLAGVYTLSFLAVMSLFAIGNMLLKLRRRNLPRETRAAWPAVIAALFAVIIGLVGNILLDPLNVEIFAAYFIAVATVVAVMFLRIQIFKLLLLTTHTMVAGLQGLNQRLRDGLISKIAEINENAMVYFTRSANPVMLNRAIQYVLQNEQTTRLLVVHVYENEGDIPAALGKNLRDLDQLYPELRVDFIAVRGEFGPPLIEALSTTLGVPKNQMFIGTPSDSFAHRIESMGGVRLILE